MGGMWYGIVGGNMEGAEEADSESAAGQTGGDVRQMLQPSGGDLKCGYGLGVSPSGGSGTTGKDRMTQENVRAGSNTKHRPPPFPVSCKL